MSDKSAPDFTRLAAAINKSEPHRRAILDVLDGAISEKRSAYDRAKDALVMSEEPRTKALLMKGQLQALQDIRKLFEDYSK